MNYQPTPLSGLRTKPTSTKTPGLTFTRQCIALALANGRAHEAAEIARARWGVKSIETRLLDGEANGLGLLTKATVPAGVTTTGGIDDLVADQGQANTEFWAAVDARSIIGRMPGLRRIPHHVKTLLESTAPNIFWIAEGGAVPNASFAFTETTGMELFKAGAIGVFTQELLKASDPSSELLVRNTLVASLARGIDDSFINPSNAGVANQKPASILSGAVDTNTNSPSVGTWDEVFESLLDNFSGSLEDSVLVMNSKLAAKLTSTDRPNVGARGGSIATIPVLTSSTVPNGIVGLIDQTSIALASPSDQAEITASSECTIEMSDGPLNASGPTGSVVATSQVSMWTSNSAAVKVMKSINWRNVRGSGHAIYSSGNQF